LKLIRIMLVVLFFTVGMSPSFPQSNYPDRPIHLIYGFPPGNDMIPRIFAGKLSERLGKPVIFENVTGAAGNIAADRTAKAAPDGNTIGILTGANITINPTLFKKLPYDPVKDLKPVSLIFGYPNLLVVNNSVPAGSVQQLIALAQRQPNALTYGHQGPGTTVHLAAEILKSMAHIEIQGVPYRGAPAVLTDLVSGRIAMAFVSPAPAMPLMKDGKLRALAVTSRSRVPFAPDIPTMEEAGFPGFEITVWFGLFVPTATPAAIVERLNREAVKIMSAPDVQKKATDIGQVALSNTPAEFTDLIKNETPFWARVIKEAGIEQIE
jgi:tripartite-type tricarboxylate transporter receptor subunit TctC